MKLNEIFTEKNTALDLEFNSAEEAIKKGGDLDDRRLNAYHGKFIIYNASFIGILF